MSDSKGKGVMPSLGGPCAACQLLQRACEPDCVFAPHFPAGDIPTRFAGVHAAFGADNVEHFLRRIHPDRQANAAHWLVLNTPWRLAVASAKAPGGGSPSCAACQHLQITCVLGCVFAPHFPAGGENLARFALLNDRFGADQIALILCGLPPEEQAEAVRWLVLQAQPPTAAAGPSAPPPQQQRLQCSACKHFRRKCEADCAFWRYYPPNDDPKRFAAVHAVYGARNLAMRLRELSPELREEANTWFVYEARRRQQDPVLGVRGDVLIYETALMMHQKELVAARKELARYIGEEAASRAFVLEDEATSRAPILAHVPRTPQELEDDVRTVYQQVESQAKADAAAGVTEFLTPLHEKLVKQKMSEVTGSSTGVPPGNPAPAQFATGILMQQPPSQAPTAATGGVQDPGLPEGEEGGDEPAQGSA